ncbi:MAG: CRP/FNR family transcriptional regulator, anaerobic regulatory protein [Rhodobacteraceae bacterium HLUCCO18]|nr:MAG: CRP/FNR family transcriptional regulator, anaerobic regulatory protein [Rhodobacteraceae bacterium HLUCCO18]
MTDRGGIDGQARQCKTVSTGWGVAGALARALPRAIVRPMSTRTRRLSLSKGSVVFSPGDPCPGFVQLESGTIRVSLSAGNGREVVLYRVQPGDVCLQTFSCLINHGTYRADGVAETDLSGTLLPPALFHARMAEDPAFRDAIFNSVARRFGDFEQLVEDVALIGFDARLARTLLRLRDGADRVTATHEQLATETASGRAFVSRRLAELARQGLVAPGRGWIDLTDIPGLERIAADQR